MYRTARESDPALHPQLMITAMEVTKSGKLHTSARPLPRCPLSRSADGDPPFSSTVGGVPAVGLSSGRARGSQVDSGIASAGGRGQPAASQIAQARRLPSQKEGPGEYRVLVRDILSHPGNNTHYSCVQGISI